MRNDISFIDLSHDSPEFDAAYDVISADIAPEYLEAREFLRNRLAVRDRGPKNEREKILVQDGYTLHLIAANERNKVLGAVYGHLISGISAENRGICFVTYLSVLPEHRRQGVGSQLIQHLAQGVNADAFRITGKPLMGTVFEIEKNGKDEMRGMAGKIGARPLDITYFQPALRQGYAPERLDLWFQPLPVLSSEAMAGFSIPVATVTDIVHNMLVMEYVGPEMKGFDVASKPYAAFLDSVWGRNEIGFINL